MNQEARLEFFSRAYRFKFCVCALFSSSFILSYCFSLPPSLPSFLPPLLLPSHHLLLLLPPHLFQFFCQGRACFGVYLFP